MCISYKVIHLLLFLFTIEITVFQANGSIASSGKKFSIKLSRLKINQKAQQIAILIKNIISAGNNRN